MTCTHERYETIMVDETDEDMGGWGDPTGRQIPETVLVRTTEDLDTHRYRCTQCGKVFYYSGAARDYYEEGKRTPGVLGLE